MPSRPGRALRGLGALVLAAVVAAGPAHAQEPAPSKSLKEQVEAAIEGGWTIDDLADAIEEVLDLVDRLRQQNADLETRVQALKDLLATERTGSTELRANLSQLSAELESALGERGDLTAKLAAISKERDKLSAKFSAVTGKSGGLSEKLATITKARDETARRFEDTKRSLDDALGTIESSGNIIESHELEIANLQADIKELGQVRELLEGEVARLAAGLKGKEEEAAGLAGRLTVSKDERQQLLDSLSTARDQSRALEARLSTGAERTALAQTDIETRETHIAELEAALEAAHADVTSAREEGTGAGRKVDLLNRQIADLRQQLQRLNAALKESETESGKHQLRLTNLEGRLKGALTRRVEELTPYRSDFYARLGVVLGGRADARIVGDRFVIQSEALFEAGSAELGGGGRERLARLANALLEMAARIPRNLNWVLEVGAHTDRVPVFAGDFPSNWELSAARAIVVVKTLITQGTPARRLVAAGYGEHRPLDPRDDEIAYRRNRRIELKLTQDAGASSAN